MSQPQHQPDPDVIYARLRDLRDLVVASFLDLERAAIKKDWQAVHIACHTMDVRMGSAKAVLRDIQDDIGLEAPQPEPCPNCWESQATRAASPYCPICKGTGYMKEVSP